MTKPTNLTAIEKATGKPWSAWAEELDAAGARDLSHAKLAELAGKRLKGLTDNVAWWAQGLTVAYEQHIGRRVPGQLANGLFEVSVSKTVASPRPELFPAIVTWFESQKRLNGQTPSKPRSSETPKRSSWRCDFEDGGRFSATVEAAGEKSKLVLAHTAIPNQEEATVWKDFWREIVGSLAVRQPV